MDTSDQFQRTEGEYNRLKESVAAGRITQEQFDTQVKQLVVQDAQGQYWAIGENGYWVRHDGPPPRVQAQSAPPPAATTPRATDFPLPLVVGILALGTLLMCALGLGAFALRSNLFGPSVALAPTPAATVALAPSLAPTEAVAPTSAAAPTSTVIPTATILPPTLAPTPTPSPTATATVALAPGVYVIGMRLEPTTPARRQDVQFFVTFLNTNDSVTNLRLAVFIYKPDNSKNSLGQTTASNLAIAAGQSEQKLQGWKLVGGGGCENLLAQVGIVEPKKVTYLNRTNGQLFQIPFSVC